MNKKDDSRLRLAQLNDAVLTSFQTREALKVQLQTAEDPVLKDALQERILLLRNEIVETTIATLPDFLEAIAYNWNNYFPFDEAYSLVLENLMASVERYEMNKKPFCKFTTFFWRYNKNILCNKIKRMHAAKRDRRKSTSLDALVSKNDSDDNDNFSRYDRFAAEEDMQEQVARESVLNALYEKANPKQKEILSRLYLGDTQTDIAKALGITGTNVNTLIRRLRKDLEKIM